MSRGLGSIFHGIKNIFKISRSGTSSHLGVLVRDIGHISKRTIRTFGNLTREAAESTARDTLRDLIRLNFVTDPKSKKMEKACNS